MNISLTPELEHFVHQKTQSGLYHSASEVIRQALRVFIESEQRNGIHAAIEAGWLEAEQGKLISGEMVFKRLRQKVAQ